MEATATSLELHCFVSGTLPRGCSAIKPNPGRLRPIIATAEQLKPKELDRRGAVVGLASLVVGASFAGFSQATIDSSALLKRYETTKSRGPPGQSAVEASATRQQTPTPQTTFTKTVKAAPTGTVSSQYSPVVLGAAALIASGFALTGSSRQSTGKGSKGRRPAMRQAAFARAPARSSGTTGASRIIGSRPLSKTFSRGRTVVVAARPQPKRNVPKLTPRKPPPKKVVKRPTPQTKGKAASGGKKDLEADRKLLGIVGFGLAIGTIFLAFIPSSGQKAAIKGAQTASISKVVAARTTTPLPPAKLASTTKAAPAPAATFKPIAKKLSAAKPRPAAKGSEAAKAKVAAGALASGKTRAFTKPKPVKAKPVSKAKIKPTPPRAVKPKTVKRKRIVTRPPRKRKTQGVSASSFAFGAIVLAAAGSYFYLEGEGKSKSSRAEESQVQVPVAPVVSPPATTAPESSPDQGTNGEEKKGLFGFGKN